MTAEIVNLNKVRKAKEREAKEREADENRIRYGLPKIERTRNEADAARSAALLDGAKIDRTARETAKDGDAGNAAASGDDDIDPGTAS